MKTGKQEGATTWIEIVPNKELTGVITSPDLTDL